MVAMAIENFSEIFEGAAEMAIKEVAPLSVQSKDMISM